jgi:hypothetical protein
LTDNLCGNVLIGEELHPQEWRLWCDSRIQVDQSGCIEKRSSQVFRGQSRMRFEKVVFAGTAAKFAQDMFYSDSCPLEHGFPHHDIGLFFDVVLPIHTLIVSWTDTSKVDLGKGKRLVVHNGVYIPKYQITVPKDLAAHDSATL